MDVKLASQLAKKMYQKKKMKTPARIAHALKTIITPSNGVLRGISPAEQRVVSSAIHMEY